MARIIKHVEPDRAYIRLQMTVEEFEWMQKCIRIAPVRTDGRSDEEKEFASRIGKVRVASMFIGMWYPL